MSVSPTIGRLILLLAAPTATAWWAEAKRQANWLPRLPERFSSQVKQPTTKGTMGPYTAPSPQGSEQQERFFPLMHTGERRSRCLLTGSPHPFIWHAGF